LKQAFYSTNAARSAFYPQITLSGTAGWTNSAGTMIINPGKVLLSAVGSLTQPLFAHGANIAQLKIAKAQQEEAKLSFQQTLLNAGAEVNDALVQVQTARGKADYVSRQIESLETAVKSTKLLMQHGTTTYLDVITAQQSLLSAQLTNVANRFNEVQGVINLYQALGGGRED
jgi:outer membrane protein TolC